MMPFRKRPGRRGGLTLMELIVVMMILVALAGIIIPMLPSMLTRAHVATHTTNVTEAAKLILTYQATHPGFPDQWDSMTDGTTLINYMAGGVLLPGGAGSAATQAGGVFAAQAPSAGELTALGGAGIFSVHYQVPDGTPGKAPAGFDPTFNNYLSPLTFNANGQPQGTPITAATKLAYLAGGNWPAFQQQNYPSWSPTANYVALGIGSRCTLMTTALQAPVHFSDTPDASPEFSYGRFIAIFKVSDPNAPGGINMAQFMGVAAIHGTGPNSLDSEFQNWYQINNGGS